MEARFKTLDRLVKKANEEQCNIFAVTEDLERLVQVKINM